MQLLDLSAIAKPITAKELEALTRDNPDARLETNAQGQLIIMPPTGGETGKKNSDLIIQIGIWNKQNKLGKIFDSSTGFRLSNGAVRSPDVSWILNSKWNALTKEQRRGYLPIDPDLVIELMSPSDYLSDTQNKMVEYINCGVRLGWLINPDEKQVEIYRGRPRADERGATLRNVSSAKESAPSKGTRPKGKEKEVLDNPQTLDGENVLPGLIIDLNEIF